MTILHTQETRRYSLPGSGLSKWIMQWWNIKQSNHVCFHHVYCIHQYVWHLTFVYSLILATYCLRQSYCLDLLSSGCSSSEVLLQCNSYRSCSLRLSKLCDFKVGFQTSNKTLFLIFQRRNFNQWFHLQQTGAETEQRKISHYKEHLKRDLSTNVWWGLFHNFSFFDRYLNG